MSDFDDKYITYYPHVVLEDLPTAFRKRWVKDLQTSKQTTGMLYRPAEGLDPRMPSGYCCLGRACKIQGIGDEELRFKAMPSSGLDNPVYLGIKGGQKRYLHEFEVKVAFRCIGKATMVRNYTFSELNDTMELTHKQIAVLISGQILRVER